MKLRTFPLEISQKQLENGLITNYEVREHKLYTPCIAFRHLPPNSARFSYATEGALFISAQLSSDMVSAPPKGSGTNMTRSNLAPKHAHKHEAHPPWVKKEKEFRLDSNNCGFVCAGVNFVGGYK